MNNISIQGPAWLASDIHLGPDNPKTAEAFFGFLNQASARAGALFLLGDLFDVWIGDDWTDDPPDWLAQALTHLEKAGKHLSLFIGHGNRDFLLGQRLAKRIGAQLLDEQCVLQVADHRVLLAHGDEFCTTDHAYQRFRRIVRHPLTQAVFARLGLKQRMAIAHRARQKSMRTQARPNAVWHDVSLAAIDRALNAAGTRMLIHGHTHRPGHFVDIVDEKPVDRWVLPDWEADHLKTGQDPRGGWIAIDAQGLTAHTLTKRNTSENKVSHH